MKKGVMINVLVYLCLATFLYECAAYIVDPGPVVIATSGSYIHNYKLYFFFMVEQVKNGRRCYRDREEELIRDFRAIDKDGTYPVSTDIKNNIH